MLNEVDSSILQYVPKGSYYNTAEEQLAKVTKTWESLLKHDRVMFSLMSLLNGTEYSKGRITHLLLSNPLKINSKDLVPYGLDSNFEKAIILHNLRKSEDMAKVVKNLLMLTGGKKDKNTKKPIFKRINNRRTRSIILEFIFDRDEQSLEELTISFKPKIRSLLKHALGKQVLYKILNGDQNLFLKYIGKYNPNAMIVIKHLFDKPISWKSKVTRFPKIKDYYALRELAKSKNSSKFLDLVKNTKLPQRTVLGFRNTYKLDVAMDEVYKKTKISKKDKIQSESAAKKHNVDLKINYDNYDLYELWKTFYNKVLSSDESNLDKIAKSIEKKSNKKFSFNFGETAVIFDSSLSMYGSESRPLHPFLTALCLVSSLNNVKKVIYVGGQFVRTKIDNHIPKIIVPSGKTDLWKGLVEAIEIKPETILVISDGYENSIKGLFNNIYNYYKQSGEKLNLIHINPVFSSEVGGARKLVDEVKPLPLSDYRYIETEFIFNQLSSNPDQVKKILSSRYQKLLGREVSE